jgi:serine/threonine protein kinase
VNVIGERFGNGFQILRQIARGAISHVYLASDGVSVKVVKLFPPEKRARAQRELELGGNLSHPHLNPIEMAVDVNGYPGVVMPFVPGRRLGEWLETLESLTPFLESFRGVLEALGYLHDCGIIHQDVKPENILVDKQAFARLLDFDLAVKAGRPHVRGFSGTIAYLSPEQARGEPATPASDLYTAGIILYRAVTGQVPFTGSIEEVMSAHRQEDPPPPSHFSAELAPFDPFFRRLLSKRAQERYENAHDVIRALDAIHAQVGDVRF